MGAVNKGIQQNLEAYNSSFIKVITVELQS